MTTDGSRRLSSSYANALTNALADLENNFTKEFGADKAKKLTGFLRPHTTSFILPRTAASVDETQGYLKLCCDKFAQEFSNEDARTLIAMTRHFIAFEQEVMNAREAFHFRSEIDAKRTPGLVPAWTVG